MAGKVTKLKTIKRIPAAFCDACRQDLPSLPLLKPYPDPGDVDLCPHCAAPLMFRRAYKRTLASRRELDALPAADQHQIFVKQVVMLAQATLFRLVRKVEKTGADGV